MDPNPSNAAVMDAKDLDQPLFDARDKGPFNPVLEPGRSAWKVLIVGDEQALHEVTVIALQGFHFQGRPLQFLHARSLPEAEELFGAEPDLAVLLLDAALETEDARLRLPHTIRARLDNQITRIVSVTDVFDDLLSTRYYKTGWEMPEVVNYFRQQRGKHFDPKLTDLLLDNLDQFVAIRDRQRRAPADD